jgi:diguanylate cyclase (GGDEF)-like protein
MMDSQEIIGKLRRGELIEPGVLSAEQFTELLKHFITTDILTGVSNLTGLNKFIQRIHAQECEERYDVYFLNIKSMRIVNEKWGRYGGDQVLRHFSERLTELTEPDGYVARSGGDNFFAFVKREQSEAFIHGASRVRMQIELDGDYFSETIESRMGACEIHTGETAIDAMEESSMALQFIRTSSDTFLSVYTPAMKEYDFKAKKLKDSFVEALRTEEFIPYYQPKVDIRTGKACGAEVLARWFHKGEMLSPGVFVPILEHTGAVCKLDFYMLDHMCKDIKRWMEKGFAPLKVSCNFSKKHLTRGNFAGQILDIIKKNQIDPRYIEIELTESIDSEDAKALQAFIEVMQENGISTSIDDFGNAYSSLRLLKEMRAETVKIDKCLIDNVGKGIRENDAILRNVALMLLDLGKEVIVEGVEEECQIEFLRQTGCNIVQGFYYAKPAPAEEFEVWLQ